VFELQKTSNVLQIAGLDFKEKGSGLTASRVEHHKKRKKWLGERKSEMKGERGGEEG